MLYTLNCEKENYPSVDYNYWLKSLETACLKPTNQYFIKVPKVLSQLQKEQGFKTLGTGIIFSPMFPLSLFYAVVIKPCIFYDNLSKAKHLYIQ